MAAKKNRFAGFESFGEAPPENAPAGKRGGKSSNPDYKKVTIYLKKQTHLRLKQHTLLADEDMSELIDRIVNDHLDSQ